MGRPENSKNGIITRIKKICLICHSEFFVEPRRKDTAKYCSEKCRRIAMPGHAKRSDTRVCPVCNKSFATTRKSTKTYCSPTCRNKDHGRKISGNKNGNFIEKIDRECPICGKNFKVSPNDHRRVHCSKSCHNISLTVPLVKFTCPVCGTEQYFTPFIAGRRKYCSLGCALTVNGISNTSIEIAIANELSASGVSFVQQYPVGWYSIDIAIPDRKIAIECDGDYWHSLPKAIIRDKAKDTFLRNKGWTIIRLKESEIHSNLPSCIKRIFEILDLA